MVLFALLVGAVEEARARPEESFSGLGLAPQLVVDSFDVGAVEARTGALLLSGQAGGTVAGALNWSLSGRSEDGEIGVPFVVEVDGGMLLGQRGGRRIAIGISAYVIDPEGRVVDHIAQGVVLDPVTFEERIAGSGLKFVGHFSLKPGDFTLRVMVENTATGDYFMSWSLLTLPASGDSKPFLLPPLFPDPGTPWVVVRQSGREPTGDAGGVTGILPAARPILVEDRPTDIFFGGGGWNADAMIEVRIVNELGRTVSAPLVEFSGPPVGEFRFRPAVLTPVDIPPGEYTMIVTLVDDSASEVLRRATRLVVVRDGERRGWTGIGDPAVTTVASGTTDDPKKAQKVSKNEIRTDYRNALRPLGEGDFVEARRSVAELERRAIAGGSRTATLALGEVELAEANALTKKAPLCMMPLALLHRDLYRGYAARGEGILASHARKMAITFAEQLGREKPYNGFSEGLMVAFAADLAQGGSSSAARDLLERALRLNRGYRPAMLSLGFSLERDSDYAEAATVYQNLVDTHPGSDEGRLRLAVNLIRNGREDAGEELLRGLLEGGARTWIEVVAAQELVRLLIQQGRGAEAEGEARAALERMPQDQRLSILLAAILERSDRQAEAVKVIIDLPPAGRGVSPRARYAEWPALGVRASDAHLSARAAEALPALREALGARGGAG